MLLVSTYVRRATRVGADLAAASVTDPESVNLSYGRLADSSSRSFPALSRMIARRTFEEEADDSDDDFMFGLDVILDGLATRIARANG